MNTYEYLVQMLYNIFSEYLNLFPRRKKERSGGKKKKKEITAVGRDKHQSQVESAGFSLTDNMTLSKSPHHVL